MADETRADALESRVEALMGELQLRDATAAALELRLKSAYKSNGRFKDMSENAGARVRVELQKNIELSERIVTLERRVSDMRDDHIRAECALKERVERALVDLQKSREREVAEAKLKCEFAAELDNVRAVLDDVQAREARAIEAFKSMEKSKNSIYKAYTELLVESRAGVANQ
jgi:hypothetical protein